MSNVKVRLHVLFVNKIGIKRVEYAWPVHCGCLIAKNVTKHSKIVSHVKMVSITNIKNAKIVHNSSIIASIVYLMKHVINVQKDST